MNVFFILFILIGLAGYILPVPALIWAWVRWWNAKPRFTPKRWRRISAFGGLTLASLLGLSVLFVMDVMDRWSGLSDDSFVLLAAIGFTGSIFAQVLSLIGNGPARLPASLASFGLASFWFMDT